MFVATGTQAQINQTTERNEKLIETFSTSSGGIVAIYESRANDLYSYGNLSRLIIRTIDASGAATGNEVTIALPSSITAGYSSDYRCILLDDGQFAVVYRHQDYSTYPAPPAEMRFQLYTVSGAANGSAQTITTVSPADDVYSSLNSHDIQANPNGGFDIIVSGSHYQGAALIHVSASGIVSEAIQTDATSIAYTPAGDRILIDDAYGYVRSVDFPGSAGPYNYYFLPNTSGATDYSPPLFAAESETSGVFAIQYGNRTGTHGVTTDNKISLVRYTDGQRPEVIVTLDFDDTASAFGSLRGFIRLADGSFAIALAFAGETEGASTAKIYHFSADGDQLGEPQVLNATGSISGMIHLEQLGTGVLVATYTGTTPSTGTDTEIFQEMFSVGPTTAPTTISTAATEADDTIRGTGQADFIIGLGGDDFISGKGGDDILQGGDGDDILQGEGGNDYLYGGAGINEMNGGMGLDVFVSEGLFDSMYGGHGAGFFYRMAAGGSYIEGGMDVDAFVGGDWLSNDSFLGGDGNDLALGGAGDDWLNGEQGNDILFGEAGDDILVGETGDDTLSGGEGDDTIYCSDPRWGETAFSGGARDGTDTIDGGEGDDRVIYAFDNIKDAIIDGSGANWTVTISGVTDTLTNIERIQFGTFIFRTTNNGLRGTADNDTIIGTASGELIKGFDGDDTLYGGAASDTLVGGAGNDTLIGGTGMDSMDGGGGDDYYYIDSTEDLTGETDSNRATGGFDTVIATADYTLGANIEQLILLGDATTGSGNASDNVLYGLNSNLALNLHGHDGDDLIYGSMAGSNWLTGGAGDDIILMFGGDNNADGGSGSDTFYTYSASDFIRDSGRDGIDTVCTNHDITLDFGIEQVVLLAGSTTATGNFGNNVFQGYLTDGAIVAYGLGGNDLFYGTAFDDTFYGGDGVDYLFGYGGANLLNGGADSDFYFIESDLDTIVELAGEGFDSIYSKAVSATIASNVEQMVLYDGGVTAFGNNNNNILLGHIASNAVVLNGEGGNDYLLDSAFNGDTLNGGAGNDQINLAAGGNDFVRYDKAGDMGADIIYGFDAEPTGGQDLLDLTGMGYDAASIGSSVSIAASGSNTLITFVSGSLAGTTITLTGISVASITATDFIF